MQCSGVVFVWITWLVICLFPPSKSRCLCVTAVTYSDSSLHHIPQEIIFRESEGLVLRQRLLVSLRGLQLQLNHIHIFSESELLFRW
jgi:hypothetical protein